MTSSPSRGQDHLLEEINLSPLGPLPDGELSSEALGKWLTVAQRIIPKLLEDLRFVRPQTLVKQGMCVCWFFLEYRNWYGLPIVCCPHENGTTGSFLTSRRPMQLCNWRKPHYKQNFKVQMSANNHIQLHHHHDSPCTVAWIKPHGPSITQHSKGLQLRARHQMIQPLHGLCNHNPRRLVAAGQDHLGWGKVEMCEWKMGKM